MNKKSIFNNTNLIIFIIINIVIWNFWTPGPKAALDFIYHSEDTLKSLFNVPLLWREVFGVYGMGQYIVSTLWSWPILFLYGLLAQLGISFTLITKFFIVVPALVFGITGINKLLSHYQLSKSASVIGTFFYICNTYFLLLLDGGHLYLGFAYMLLPWAIYHYLNNLKTNLWQDKLWFVISVIGIFAFDLRIISLILLVILINFLFTALSTKGIFLALLKSHIILGSVTILFLTLLHSYWLVPSFIGGSSVSLVSNQLEEIESLSFANFGHAVLLLQPHWFKNIFGQITNLRPEFFLIPLLVFAAPILNPKNRIVGFWMIIAVISVFLTKGFNDPMPEVYKWMIENIPGFVLFRDPTKFFFLVGLSYSILISFSVESLLRLVNKHSFTLQSYLFGGMLILLIILVWPVYSGNMTGLFSTSPYKSEYAQLSNYLSSQEEYSRVMWVPSLPPLGYASPIHPAVEAIYLPLTQRAFYIGIDGAYETLNFLREGAYIGEILDISSIGYIAYPPLDLRRDKFEQEDIEYYEEFLKQISDQPWVVEKIKESPIILLKLKTPQDKLFVADNFWWVIGSDDIYNQATQSAQLKLSNNALFFKEERLNNEIDINDFSEAKILLNNKTDTDLAASFIDNKDLYFPSDKLKKDPDQTGWWKRNSGDVVSWRDFLQTKYEIDNKDFSLGGGLAVAEGNLELSVNLDNQKDKILLVRALESSRSGVLKFDQDGRLLGSIDTHVQKLPNGLSSNLRWFEVGNLANGKDITLTTEGEINVINAISVIDHQEWNEYQKTVELLKSQGRIYNGYDKSEDLNDVDINYQEINPTKYKITITGIKSPAMILFTGNYDSLWQLNGISSMPVYSLINGFRVDKDGEYILELSTQKYVYHGLGISLIGLIVLLILFFTSRIKK